MHLELLDVSPGSVVVTVRALLLNLPAANAIFRAAVAEQLSAALGVPVQQGSVTMRWVQVLAPSPPPPSRPPLSPPPRRPPIVPVLFSLSLAPPPPPATYEQYLPPVIILAIGIVFLCVAAVYCHIRQPTTVRTVKLRKRAPEHDVDAKDVALLIEAPKGHTGASIHEDHDPAAVANPLIAFRMQDNKRKAKENETRAKERARELGRRKHLQEAEARRAARSKGAGSSQGDRFRATTFTGGSHALSRLGVRVVKE